MGRRLSGMPLAALALLVAGALGACESEEPPLASPSPTASTSASPSPSATPTPSGSASSDIPAAAREKSEKGAEAFARHYIEQSGRAWTVPDPALIKGLGTPACKTCSNLESTAAKLVEDRQRYDASPITVNQLKALRGDRDSWVFDAALTENSVRVVAEDGSVIAKYPSRQITRAVAVVWKEGHWWVDGIGE